MNFNKSQLKIMNSLVEYGIVNKIFHWLIFLVVVMLVIYGYFNSYLPKSFRPLGWNLHKLGGLSVLVLTSLRFMWVMFNPKPVSLNNHWLARLAERGVHWLLYGVLVTMPLAGWVATSSAQSAPHIGTFSLSLPLSKDKALIDAAFSIHNAFAIILLVLVSLHVLAALYHHFIKKDGILRRML